MPGTALPDPALVTGLAFALAFVFGAVAYRVSFCTMGSITDIVTFGDWRRMRMWLLAIVVAIAGINLKFSTPIKLRKFFEKKLKVEKWIQAVLFGGLYETVDDGAGSRRS